MKDSLRVWRQRSNMTISEASKIVHISPVTLASYETGKVCPQVDVVVDLARLYGVKSLDSIDFLLPNGSL